MRLLVLVDTYVPARISGALQMRDLMRELVAQGHVPCVLVPSEGRGAPVLESLDGVQVLRVRCPRSKDVGKLRRLFAEWWMPRALLAGLRRSQLAREHWDGVLWYSPTIFLGPAVRAVKRRHRCRSYLILRDLFPDWVVDAGMMRRGGLAHRLLKRVERAQYREADVIGVQTPANVALVARDCPPGACIEVLHNWLAEPPLKPAALQLQDGPLAGRLVFAYTGNMGVAQGMDGVLDLAQRLRDRRDLGFLFVGRGSEVARLQERVRRDELDNVLFVDEIDAEQIPGVLAQCHVGLVALDPRHGTHNIPGKLLTYLHAGLPVLARINPGNDLQELIQREGIGAVVAGDDLDALERCALHIAGEAGLRAEMGVRGRALVKRLFDPPSIARQVLRGLDPKQR
jgi:glycosyltransferase involved in cell wall biosynthesis